MTITITTKMMAIVMIMKAITIIKVVLIIKLMTPGCDQSQKKLFSYFKQHGKEIKRFFTNTKTEP